MGGRAVCMVAVGDLPYAEYGIRTWRDWCTRRSISFHLIDHDGGLHPTFSKYRVFELFPDVDRFTVVDADTMVRWDCPDFAEGVGTSFGACVDLGHVGWIVQSLQAHEPFFPCVNVPWWDYVNSGVLVMSRAHQRVAEGVLTWAREHPEPIRFGNNWRSYDQTVLNYVLRELGTLVHYLPLDFNLTKIRQRGLWEERRYVDVAHVWHFNENRKESDMAETWEVVRRHYS